MRTEEASPTTDGQVLADIGHVHLRVADLDRTLDFYVETIGMRVVLRQPKHAFLAFGDYHHHLALDARGDFEARAEDADRRAGLHHFAIRFPDERSLRAVVDRLRALGAELKGADFAALRAVFTKDPDGNGIELSCDRPRESWPATWASVEGIGRWRPLDPAELGELRSEPSRFLCRAPGGGDGYWTVGMRMAILVPGSATEGRFELSEFECPPGFATPLHVHSREDETLRVLEGGIRYVCGEIAGSAAAGATIHLPRGVPHAFATSGESPGRAFAIIGSVLTFKNDPATDTDPLVFEHRERPGGFVPPHREPNSESFFVLEGTLEVEVEGQRYELRPGDFLMVAPGAEHSLRKAGADWMRFCHVPLVPHTQELDDVLDITRTLNPTAHPASFTCTGRVRPSSMLRAAL